MTGGPWFAKITPDDPPEEELWALIDGLNNDEKTDLVALMCPAIPSPTSNPKRYRSRARHQDFTRIPQGMRRSAIGRSPLEESR